VVLCMKVEQILARRLHYFLQGSNSRAYTHNKILSTMLEPDHSRG
jgi:hypothetical protein